MDLAYWGLRDTPYRITLTPSRLSLLPHQSNAARRINTAFASGERVALLLGEHGLGKTLLAQHLVGQAEARGTASAWAACVPDISGPALYQMLLADLGQPFSLKSSIELRIQLVEHLLPRISESKAVLLVVDEAQHVPSAILEELRPLIEMVTPTGTPGVQVLLVGTERLLVHLHGSSQIGLRSWVGCQAELKPLELAAAEAYLQQQWKLVGGDPGKHATEEAWSMLAELSNGVPLLLNRLAQRAFHLAAEFQQKTLDAEIVWETAQDLGLIKEEAEGEEASLPLPVRGALKESA
jgi:type II secretory pathway predicted ATPase ExeA